MGRLIILIFMILLSSNFTRADNHDIAYQLKQQGEILPLEKIIKISKQMQPGQILEVELEVENELFIYELEILDKNNIVWEVKINAKTGQLIEREID